jgi:hypothetical protein
LLNVTNTVAALRPRRDFICLVIVTAVLGVGGCASQKPTGPLSESIRRDMGRVGVVAAAGAEPQLQRPWVKSEAAGRGALMGAGQTMGGGGASPMGAGIALVLMPFMAGAGAASAKAHAIDDAVVREQMQQLRSAAMGMKIEDALREDFLRLAASETGGAARVGPMGGGDATGDAPDTVFKLSIEKFGLEGPDEVNPRLTPFLSVCGRLTRAADGKELYAKTWWATGHDAKAFSEWARGGEEGLRAAFGPLSDYISQEAVSDLFLVVLIP